MVSLAEPALSLSLPELFFIIANKHTRTFTTSHRSGDYKKVPIALIDGTQVNGSDDIVAALMNDPRVVASLEQKWNDSMTLEDFTSSPSAIKWTAFANDELAALLYPNICKTWSDSYAAFAYVNNVPAFSTLQKLSIRGIGSLAMYLAASKIKCKC
jgi:microsomal prostaglandin-E synthase 2